jgi:hypothetical protein
MPLFIFTSVTEILEESIINVVNAVGKIKDGSIP